MLEVHNINGRLTTRNVWYTTDDYGTLWRFVETESGVRFWWDAIYERAMMKILKHTEWMVDTMFETIKTPVEKKQNYRREWVDLTRTQIEDVYFKVLKEYGGGPQMEGQLAFGEALQAKIKEKNI